MADFQKVLPVKLGHSAIGTSYSVLYTVPVNTRTYLKALDICNTTGATIGVYVHVVPSGGTAGTDNAVFYNYDITKNAPLQWHGVQVMNAGDTLQVKASATGACIMSSGGEAV